MNATKNLLRHLDVKHLRQLIEVADKGSIRAAAEALAITQPALSRSIRALEEDLGVKLVERGPSGAELTPIGTRLVKYSRIIDANLALAEREVRGFRDHSDRFEHISLGMSWLSEALIGAALFKRILRDRPGVRLTTTVGDYESLAPQLASGKIDFFVGPPPMEGPAAGVKSERLMEFPAAAIVRAQHPLARRAELAVADLVTADWVLPAAGTVPRLTYDNYFLRHGAAPPDPVFEVQPLSPVIRKLILDTDLVTILPLVVVQCEIEAGLFRVLPFDDEIVFPLHVVQRQMRHASNARDYVIAEIKRLFADLSAREPARQPV